MLTLFSFVYDLVKAIFDGKRAVIAIVVAVVIVGAAYGGIQLVRSFSGCGFSDDFRAGSLNAKWSQVNLVNGSNAYSVGLGQLSMSATSGTDLFPDNGYNAPRILQSVRGDFTITTTLTLNPVANVLHVNPADPSVADAYQGAGLVIWGGDQDFIRLERGYRGVGVDDIEFLAYAGGIALTNSHDETQGAQVTLMLQRSGNTITASWGNGTDTTEPMGSTQLQVTDIEAGLALINNSGNGPTVANSAAFSDFTITCG